MSESALLQFGNAVLCVVMAVFVLGATEKPLTGRVRRWMGVSMLLTALMYFGRLVCALSEPRGGLTNSQACTAR